MPPLMELEIRDAVKGGIFTGKEQKQANIKAAAERGFAAVLDLIRDTLLERKNFSILEEGEKIQYKDFVIGSQGGATDVDLDVDINKAYYTSIEQGKKKPPKEFITIPVSLKSRNPQDFSQRINMLVGKFGFHRPNTSHTMESDPEFRQPKQDGAEVCTANYFNNAEQKAAITVGLDDLLNNLGIKERAEQLFREATTSKEAAPTK